MIKSTSQSSSQFDLVKSLPSVRELPTRNTKLRKVVRSSIPLANLGHKIPQSLPVSTHPSLPTQRLSDSDNSDSEKSAASPNWG